MNTLIVIYSFSVCRVQQWDFQNGRVKVSLGLITCVVYSIILLTRLWTFPSWVYSLVSEVYHSV